LQAYAELLIETFSADELQKGTFTAVGMIHRPQEKEEAHKFPHYLSHYWPDYDPQLARQDPKPQTFVQYVFAGQGKSKQANEAYFVVEKVAEGILRLASMVQEATSLRRRRYSHRYVMNLLGQDADTWEDYQALVAEFATRRHVLTKEDWDGRWRGIVRQIAETIAGSALLEEASDFLAWKDVGDGSGPTNMRRSQDNVYRYPSDEPKVGVYVGSIHSVKGKEHTATLVLETHWYKHNLAKLKPWIIEGRTGWKKSDGDRQQERLKVHYVAMTRPTHLLCLAMKRNTFEASDYSDKDLNGWQVLDVTGR